MSAGTCTAAIDDMVVVHTTISADKPPGSVLGCGEEVALSQGEAKHAAAEGMHAAGRCGGLPQPQNARKCVKSARGVKQQQRGADGCTTFIIMHPQAADVAAEV